VPFCPDPESAHNVRPAYRGTAVARARILCYIQAKYIHIIYMRPTGVAVCVIIILRLSFIYFHPIVAANDARVYALDFFIFFKYIAPAPSQSYTHRPVRATSPINDRVYVRIGMRNVGVRTYFVYFIYTALVYLCARTRNRIFPLCYIIILL